MVFPESAKGADTRRQTGKERLWSLGDAAETGARLARAFVNPAIATILLIPALGANKAPMVDDLIVHEWGTFTSVAGINGASVPWAPLSGPADLPCFVNRLNPRQNFKLAEGLVRMETPVVYFYSPRSLALSLHVQFPRGWITEWYPQATRVQPEFSGNSRNWPNFGNGQIEWDGIRLLPGEHSAFPSSQAPSRYYAARNTDSAPISIGNEREKLIFYRGMANFAAPLTAAFAIDGKLTITNTGPDTIPLVIFFENRNGKVGYRLAHGLMKSTTLDPPELTGSLPNLRQQFVDSLVEFGLYRKEAAAMVETWHDSWFEEGARVFYIVPRSFVDLQLQLEIAPRPAAVNRVFVGRVETLSPGTQQTIEAALSTGDVQTLTKFSRFLDPFILQIQASKGMIAQSQATQAYLQKARDNIWRELNSRSCVR